MGCLICDIYACRVSELVVYTSIYIHDNDEGQKELEDETACKVCLDMKRTWPVMIAEGGIFENRFKLGVDEKGQ